MTPAPTIADRSVLEEVQLEALRRVVAAQVPANRFYAPRLVAAGLDRGVASLADFSARLPLTTKADFVADQAAHPPYGSNLTQSLDRYTRYNQTSGTTSAPLRWLDTPAGWDWMLGNWQAVLLAAGVTPADRVYFAFSFGPFLGFWTAFEAAARLGCLCLPGGGLSSVGRLRTLFDTGATVLCCTPTYALRLGASAGEAGVDLRHAPVRTIIVGGEPGGGIPATRERLQALWPTATLVDHHGMTEVGPVSYGCPKRPGVLHIIESAYYAEVLDPATLAPVAPGGTGELVLTTLGRADSPALRYRTGDLVRTAAEPRCACGRTELALEGGIIGRADDLVVVRGVKVYPAAVEQIVRRVDGVAEYRVEVRTVRGMSELTLLVEPADDVAPAALTDRLRHELHAALSLRVEVQAAPAGSLPRFEMKARRWTRVDAGT